MENGGVIVRKDGEGILTEEVLVPAAELHRLENLVTVVEKKFPGILTIDSFGRKTDRAVDLKLMDQALKPRVEDFLTQRGARFLASDIHLNFWYGEISKYRAIQVALKKDFIGVSPDDCIYFGDALNDQSVFQHMKHTVGVSNIAKYLPLMSHHPQVVLEGAENSSVKGVYNFLKSLA